MNSQGDSFGDDRAASLPAGFKYLIGGAAFFIAGCSAFFSVRGLGLLFVGSSTAVMIMAASLEIGKLVAASFLYRYWQDISRPLRVYLTLAVLTLIGITSLGNYGFLARAYEDTYTRVSGFEEQVALLEKENADTQRQIVSARGQLNKATDTGRDSVTSLQTRIAAANASLDQALARIQEKRNTAQARRDRDIQTLAQHLAGRTDPLTKALASEDALITGLNSQLAVLDRAVDATLNKAAPVYSGSTVLKKARNSATSNPRTASTSPAKSPTIAPSRSNSVPNSPKITKPMIKTPAASANNSTPQPLRLILKKKNFAKPMPIPLRKLSSRLPACNPLAKPLVAPAAR